MRKFSYEWLAGLREIVIDPVRFPKTYEEFALKDYLHSLGFALPLDDMEPWIRSWDDWTGTHGGFYDYRNRDELDGCTRFTGGPVTRRCACAGSEALASTRKSRLSLE